MLPTAMINSSSWMFALALVLFPVAAQSSEVLFSDMDFVPIPAGSFTMGSPLDEAGRHANEGPAHRVRIRHDFEMQVTHVTQRQWMGLMENNPSSIRFEPFCRATWTTVNGVYLCPRNPVDSVSWNDVQNFIRELNQSTTGYEYRLPTEAEWEYAARARTQSAYYFGIDEKDLDDHGWHFGNSLVQVRWVPTPGWAAVSHPVGSKKKNAFGLYDMSGNLWQWVQDRYRNYPGIAVFQDPFVRSAGRDRVIRGGSYLDDTRDLRSAVRRNDGFEGNVGWRDTGFRLLRVRKR